MRKHDAHVRRYERHMYRAYKKTLNPIYSSVLFLFIVFVIIMGFYLGYSYAVFVDGLFNCIK